MQIISIQNITDRPIIDAIAPEDFLLIGDASDNGVVKRVLISSLATYFSSPSPNPNPNPQNTSFRINCGGTSYTDSQGRAWIADNYLVSGANYTRMDSDSWQLPDGEIYLTESYDFVYEIPVVAGNYTVRLHFSEFDNDPNFPRSFGVLINSVAVLSNYSILDDVGLYAPVIKSFDITVAGGSIDIVGVEGAGGLRFSKLNGIEVIAT